MKRFQYVEFIKEDTLCSSQQFVCDDCVNNFVDCLRFMNSDIEDEEEFNEYFNSFKNKQKDNMLILDNEHITIMIIELDEE